MRSVVNWRVRSAGMKDRNFHDLRRVIRPVVSIAWHACDFLHQLDAGVIALPKDGIAAIQTRIGHFGDKKLRAIGIRPGVGVGQPARAIEL